MSSTNPLVDVEPFLRAAKSAIGRLSLTATPAQLRQHALIRDHNGRIELIVSDGYHITCWSCGTSEVPVRLLAHVRDLKRLCAMWKPRRTRPAQVSIIGDAIDTVPLRPAIGGDGYPNVDYIRTQQPHIARVRTTVAALRTLVGNVNSVVFKVHPPCAERGAVLDVNQYVTVGACEYLLVPGDSSDRTKLAMLLAKSFRITDVVCSTPVSVRIDTRFFMPVLSTVPRSHVLTIELRHELASHLSVPECGLDIYAMPMR